MREIRTTVAAVAVATLVSLSVAQQSGDSAPAGSPGAARGAGSNSGVITAVPVQRQAGLPARQALVSEPPPGEQVNPSEVLEQIPDPSIAVETFNRRLQALEADARSRLRNVGQDEARWSEDRVWQNYSNVVREATKLLNELPHGERLELSLRECIQRALANSYAIRYESYTPAISRTQVVQAEAAFDAVFFLDGSWANIDQATASELSAGQSDQRSYEGGIRKLLPTGMQAQISLGQTRSYTDLQFQTLNPAYQSRFTASITQPLLRNFGLDYNLSEIRIRQAEHRISFEQFIQQVRETLLNVETAYWRLAQARRTVSVLAETTAQNYVTFQYYKGREGHDATPVAVGNSQARWRNSQVSFKEAVRNVADAEDALKNLLNDPDLLLSENIEIIPTATPIATPFAIDQFAEVRTALDERSEIRQAKAGIEQTRIQTAAAKNQLLPQLDLGFQYEVQGIGVSADSSFDNLTTDRFRSYTLSLQFSMPIGNRAARSGYRRAQLQESQAVTGLHRIMDTVVLEVNNAIRQLRVRYSQISPQLDAVQAAARNLQALQARAKSIDPSYLETELNGVEQLGNSRQQLLQVMMDYNIGVAQLERAKGTLLQYNNVVITNDPHGR